MHLIREETAVFKTEQRWFAETDAVLAYIQSEIACANFSASLLGKSLRNGDSVKKLFEQIVKFGIVGAIAFVIDFAVLFILVEYFSMDSIAAATISFIVSVIFNYLASMKYVFVGRTDQSKKMQFIIFVVLSAIGLLINDGIMHLANLILAGIIPDFYYMISKVFATGVVMVWNFISRKIFLEQK